MNINFTVGMDETPTLPQLMMFGVRHVNIIEEIQDKYHKFGIALLEDETGNKMKTIEMKNRGNGGAINVAALRMWMKGEGIKPTNWATLATVLDKCGFATLACEMRSMEANPGKS